MANLSRQRNWTVGEQTNKQRSAHIVFVDNQGTKLLKRLGGQDVTANVNENCSQKYNNEFLRTLFSNHCAISQWRKNIINLLKSVIYYVIARMLG